MIAGLKRAHRRQKRVVLRGVEIVRHVLPYVADQLIVTEYQPGDGIRPHVDAPIFEEVIVGVALGYTCVMEFLRDGHAAETLLLEPRSATVLAGDARHAWQHAIPARGADEWEGQRLRRSRRVSLTFRKMRPTDPEACP